MGIGRWFREIPIPTGPYCYSTLGIYGPFKIRRCPYWKLIGVQQARCEYAEMQDEYPQDTLCLWDHVKCCGIKMGAISNETGKRT